jgi:CheY-like chemotaxis protein
VGAGSAFWFSLRYPKGQTSRSVQPANGVEAETIRKMSAAPPSAAPAALRVLVADDSVVNRQITKELLEHLGYQVDQVVDGVEVLLAMQSNAYAAVLMDCQMPKMSGYDATKELRRREHGARTPIIAVTAHAMAGERERALEAGMDDYLAKPLCPEGLAATMRRWTSGTPSTTDEMPSTAQPNETSAEILSSKSRRSQKVAKLFLEELAGRLNRLRRSLDLADIEGWQADAHQLKGSSVSIGALRLAKTMAELEEKPLADVKRAFPRLEAEVEAVRRALRTELKLSDPPPGVEVPR